jgi:hypothetical protein
MALPCSNQFDPRFVLVLQKYETNISLKLNLHYGPRRQMNGLTRG